MNPCPYCKGYHHDFKVCDEYIKSLEGKMTDQKPRELAKRFHEIYERLAPDFNYKTREASAVPWDDVPDNNKNLMVAVCKELNVIEKSAYTAKCREVEELERALKHQGQLVNSLNELIDKIKHQQGEGK